MIRQPKQLREFYNETENYYAVKQYFSKTNTWPSHSHINDFLEFQLVRWKIV